MNATEIISQEEIEAIFEGTNFGPSPNYSNILANGCLKVLNGYASGHTLTCIMRDLGLTVEQYGNTYLTVIGKEFTYWSFARCLDENSD